VLATYTLTVWCMKIPRIITFFRDFKNENKYFNIWRSNARLRVNVSLFTTLVMNFAYALLHLGMGLKHHTFWFYSLFGYYLSLCVMRLYLVNYTSRHKQGEKILVELKKYRICGIAFLVMNLALSLMIFFMVYWNRTFNHHEITTIALAAFTFTSLTLAIVNIVKYRRIGSPVYSASKAISLASACVSMLTLESTMLTTFGHDTMTLSDRRIFLGLSGGAISVFIITMAIFMIVKSTKEIKSTISEGAKNG